MNPSRPTADKIRYRAYELDRDRGGRPGHEIDDWLRAEYELTQLPVRQIAKLQNRAVGFPVSPLVNLVQAAVFLGENI